MGKYRIEKTEFGIKGSRVPFYKEHEKTLWIVGSVVLLVIAIIIRAILGD